MNPPVYIGKVALAHYLIRGALKKRNRIEEISNPYGISVSTAFITLVYPPSIINVALSIRKLNAHRIILSGTLLSFRL